MAARQQSGGITITEENRLPYRPHGEKGNRMDVYDFCMLSTDESIDVVIYDFDGEDTVFNGSMKEAMDSDWKDYEVQSFDVDFLNKVFYLNIDTSEVE